MNLTLARRGQAVAQENIFSMGFSHAFGLMFTFYLDGTNVLIYSGSSANSTISTHRYLATVTQVFVWYQSGLLSHYDNETDIIAR